MRFALGFCPYMICSKLKMVVYLMSSNINSRGVPIVTRTRASKVVHQSIKLRRIIPRKLLIRNTLPQELAQCLPPLIHMNFNSFSFDTNRLIFSFPSIYPYFPSRGKSCQHVLLYILSKKSRKKAWEGSSGATITSTALGQRGRWCRSKIYTMHRRSRTP
jgi:hypothetical protein